MIKKNHFVLHQSCGDMGKGVYFFFWISKLENAKGVQPKYFSFIQGKTTAVVNLIKKMFTVVLLLLSETKFSVSLPYIYIYIYIFSDLFS